MASDWMQQWTKDDNKCPSSHPSNWDNFLKVVSNGKLKKQNILKSYLELEIIRKKLQVFYMPAYPVIVFSFV